MKLLALLLVLSAAACGQSFFSAGELDLGRSPYDLSAAIHPGFDLNATPDLGSSD